ncbi:hypothetical protein G7Y89_g4196 [Cudoniella acicularis]|uniref:Uncharacterized protein n=1 Tax=Cudoniella acicularis TaxID=354080 RepID=A0A8H4RSY3_9HELO|nr:hypothetical protein G7Y89_g4196 [Cudoniella acicularis]
MSPNLTSRYFLAVWLQIFLLAEIINARRIALTNAIGTASVTFARRDFSSASISAGTPITIAPSALPTAAPRTLHGGTQWVSLSGTTEIQYDMTISNMIPVWTANETNFLTVLPATATNASPSTVYFSFITSTPSSISGVPMAEPSIQAVVIAPALIPVLQRIISSGGGDKTNDTIDEQIVGALAARGYEASNAELIPLLGILITFLRLNFGTDPNAGLKVSPYLDMNERIPDYVTVISTSSEEPIVTAIPELAYPDWMNLRVFYPPVGPLPTDFDFGSPYTSTSVSKAAPTPTCFPNSLSANTSEAIDHAKEFCGGSVMSANDTCEYIQWAGTNQYLALGYEASNGTCMADCPTTFANMFNTCQSGDTISGSAVFVDGCGSFAFNITDIPPRRPIPRFLRRRTQPSTATTPHKPSKSPGLPPTGKYMQLNHFGKLLVADGN